MDKEIRTRIQRATQAARRLLEEEYREQLEGNFDVHLDGRIASAGGPHLTEAQRLQRERLVAVIAHRRSSGASSAEAVGSYLREAAFTTLNRLVALKMLEARGLVQECISEGDQSRGFREFSGLAPGLVQLADRGYQLYVEAIFDEVAQEIRGLFLRQDPGAILWPRRQSLHAVLQVINDRELTPVWTEDETIGWVFQYFNTDDERKEMRAESQAPRDSRELAARNQFFTPRYVVRYLVDNTLGRTWCEMRRGATALRSLEYLVRKRSDAVDGTVPFQERRDPRDIRLLDPACGSGHFLLYAFDLFYTMYEEAWSDAEAPPSEVTGKTILADFPDRADLVRAIPGLILRHNLYGIEIDARCAQIAALALWLRAQRALAGHGIAPEARPPVKRTNVVVAEAIPGTVEQRRHLESTLPPNLAKLFGHVVERMRVAGEAGALLRIEDDIQRAVQEIYPERGGLFQASDAERWRGVEQELLAALRAFAEQASGSESYRRKLFADDAARGLGFIDVVSQKYDVVLMNPPFGDASVRSLGVLDDVLSKCGRDIGAAFVYEASQRWAPRGRIGVLLSTAPWFKPVFEGWRDAVFSGSDCQMEVAAHFGGEVLDGATVNASPFVVAAPSQAGKEAIVFRLTRHPDLEQSLLSAISSTRQGAEDSDVFYVRPAEVRFLPGNPFCYWVSSSLRRRVAALPAFEGNGGTVKQGTATADEFRFARAWWEVRHSDRQWVTYSKSSPYSPFWDDLTWVGLFGDGMRELAAFPRAYIRNPEFYGRPGVTYPSKSVLGFNPRLHPTGSAFGHSGSVAFPSECSALALLGFLGSRPLEYLLSLFIGELQGKAGVHPNHYEVGTIQRLPWPSISSEAGAELERAAGDAVRAVMRLDRLDETTREFRSPLLDLDEGVAGNLDAVQALETAAVRTVCESRLRCDAVVSEAYGFSEHDLQELDQAFAGRVPPATGRWRVYFGRSGSDLDELEYARRVASWLFGLAIGRWRPCHNDGGGDVVVDVVAEPSRRSPAEVDGSDLGVLVDDPGNALDVCDGVRRAAAAANWQSVSVEPLEELSLQLMPRGGGLRDYFRKNFFDDHVKRYSKSRRKAPVYWQLASASGMYSIWVHYHQLNGDTLFKILDKLVDPKVLHEDRRLAQLQKEAAVTSTISLRTDLEAQEALVSELRAFRDEIRRVAPLWHPNLTDGALINCAPLWRVMTQSRGWQKECRKVWDQLAAGAYDWAHLAMHLWPERVVPKCAADRSLAIAHGLEERLWQEDSSGKWISRGVDEESLRELVAEHSSAAVKAALAGLQATPMPRPNRTRRGSSAQRTRARVSAPARIEQESEHGAHAGIGTNILQAIASFPHGAAKADVLAATGISEPAWGHAVKTLIERGEVSRTGRGRGTRYHANRSAGDHA